MPLSVRKRQIAQTSDCGGKDPREAAESCTLVATFVVPWLLPSRPHSRRAREVSATARTGGEPQMTPKPATQTIALAAYAVVAFAVASVLAPLASAAHSTTTSLSVSRTHDVEPGDDLLVTGRSFKANVDVFVSIDGELVYQGKTDTFGNFTASVQVPWEVNDDNVKLTATDNTHTQEVNLNIESSVEGLVETMQEMSPLAKILVTIVVILIPLFLLVLAWNYTMK